MFGGVELVNPAFAGVTLGSADMGNTAALCGNISQFRIEDIRAR